MIRVRITKSKVSDDLSVRVQLELELAGLRNTNRGRNIDKRTFDTRTMGGEYSLLDIPEDVNSAYNTKNSYKK